MKVTVELANPLDEFAGVDRLLVEVPNKATGAELIRLLNKQYAEVLAVNRLLVPGRVILFVGREYVDLETALKDSDIVRIVPYISCCHP